MKNSEFKKLNYFAAATALISSLVIYLLTMAPTASFWDCGEFIATSHIMGVPHPPGSPLYLLLGNFFSQIPTFTDIGARVNLMSPISSAFAVMFLYLITVFLIEEFKGRVNSMADAIVVYGSSFVGAMTFAVTDSHWFNAVEAEVYAMATFFTGIVVWLILVWSRKEGLPGNVRYILIIAYMIGIATGVHLLNLLTLPFIALIIYFKKYEFTSFTFGILITIPLIVYLLIYQGIIKGLPNLADKAGIYVPIFIVLAVFAAMVFAIMNHKHLMATIITSFFLVIVGYSTYATIFIRAQQSPFINENDPSTLKKAVSYLNREQYGDWSILDRAESLKTSSYANRWTNTPQSPKTDEVREFVWNYQIKEMYLRYFAWQFIGRGESNWPLYTKGNPNKPGDTGRYIKSLDGIDVFRYGLPLAFLIGVFGISYHFRRDWKRALAVLSLFAATGIMIILYLNQYDPQPRERDYSYAGSFFAFSIWIGIGIAGILDFIRGFLTDKEFFKPLAIVSLIAIMGFMPGKMLAKDFREHNRSGNYVAWDYAYNMLNSCEPYGIIFTNGDNDTFPLWYLQEVENVRKDVRVVNLSLLNTDWYIKQLRDYDPPIDLPMSDEDIANVMPVRWSAKKLTIPGPEGTDKELIWELKPTYRGRFLRVQDIMIYRIIDAVKWEKPVYFAVTVSDDNRIGLDQYLQMEGMVFKLHPEKVSQINYARMKQNIIQSENVDFVIRTPEQFEEYIASGDGVYHYRNMNNPDVHFNFNIQRLVQNYRAGFLQLAIQNIRKESEKNEETLEILQAMDNTFPPEYLPYNNDNLELQVAQLYSMIGEEDELKERLKQLQSRENQNAETMFNIGQMYMSELNDLAQARRIFMELYSVYPNNYEFMLATVQSFARTNEIPKAIEILTDWMDRNPNNTGQAEQWLEILQGQT